MIQAEYLKLSDVYIPILDVLHPHSAETCPDPSF